MEQLIPLKQVLMLVGELDDAQGQNPARERFRTFLSENLTQIGDMRDYMEECLRTPEISIIKPCRILSII
ncbi:hypothetical protein [Mahella australiensis]|uniref:hypothetical protein n=1 Tax=Mahella australiensis TaxID=252966 RepID=UPI001C0A8DC5|nr:hypothetical protein [Mahella australiensis]